MSYSEGCFGYTSLIPIPKNNLSLSGSLAFFLVYQWIYQMTANVESQKSKPSKTFIYLMVASALILALSLGVRHGFALYLTPMSEAYGWGHQVFSLAIAMQNLIWGFTQPFTGAIADKYGTKIVVIVGGALYALGLVVMAFSSTGLLLNMGLGLIIGVALSATSFTTLLSAVGRAVRPERRSMAMGIASAAGSFGQFAMLPATLLLIKHMGWSAALLVSAGLIALIVPLAFLINENTQQSTITASGVTPKRLPVSMADFKKVLGIAGRHKPFLWLALGFFVCGFQVVFLGVHLPGYLIDHGFSATNGTVFFRPWWGCLMCLVLMGLAGWVIDTLKPSF